jgi:hypothetical protein
MMSKGNWTRSSGCISELQRQFNNNQSLCTDGDFDEDNDPKDKQLLAFFLAIMNNQVEVANFFLNHDDKLKLLIIRVSQSQD